MAGLLSGELIKLAVWAKGTPIPGYDPNVSRRLSQPPHGSSRHTPPPRPTNDRSGVYRNFVWQT